MSQRILHNKDLFASVVLLLMTMSLFADMALPGARQIDEISPHNRLPCHAIQLAILGAMFLFVGCNYTLPRVRAILFWELSLIVFLSLSLCHAMFISSREQLITFTKFVYWPIGYFFFRMMTDDVRGYTKKLSYLLFALCIFAVWYYVSQAELRAEIATRAQSGGLVSSNVGWTLLSVFTVSLCLAAAGNAKGYVVGTAALLLVPFSLKRGAILAEAALGISLLLVGHRLGLLRTAVRRNMRWIVVGVTIWSIVCISHLPWVVRRFTGLTEDGGSGRSQFYWLLFDRWRQADLFHWLFGFGFWSAPDYLESVWLQGIYAHSDVLEMLHDYGMVGILSYLMILGGLFALCRYTWRLRDEGLIIAASVFSIFLIAGLICGNVMFRGTVYLMMPLGCMAGKLEKAHAARGLVHDEPFPVNREVSQYSIV